MLVVILLADDFGVGGRHRDAFEAAAVEIKNDFQVLAADTEAIEILTGGIVGIESFGGDRAGQHFLRDENGKGLNSFA